jgi:hypothetical protein
LFEFNRILIRAEPAVVCEPSSDAVAVSVAAFVVVVGSLGGTIIVGTFEAITAVEGMTKIVSGVRVRLCSVAWVRVALAVELEADVVEVGAAKIKVVAVGT